MELEAPSEKEDRIVEVGMRPNALPLSHPFVVVRRRQMALLEHWIKDEVIQLHEVESLPTTKDLKHSKYCP